MPAEQKTDCSRLDPALVCTGCGRCMSVCPQDCIDLTHVPAEIKQEHCLHCGNCLEVCPVKAVVRL